MFVVFLKFAEHKEKAPAFMDAHNAWIQQGFDDEVFLLVGSLADGQGGSLLAHNIDEPALRRRVDEDPFVQHGIVAAEIMAIVPARTDARLEFLLNQ